MNKTSETESSALQEKEQRLVESLRAFGSVLVAYSGGVDSAYLAYTAHRALGDRMLAVTAVSPSLSGHQKQKAESFARQYGIPHLFIESHEFENEAYLANTPDRCYICKSDLFEHLGKIAASRRLSSIVHGVNLDDLNDFRPGHKAADEHSVKGPLLDAGLSKLEIRKLSAMHDLTTSEDPTSPCLASRIPYLERIDLEKIRQIEKGEDLLRECGFPEMRLRHHGDMARIEVPLQDLPHIVESEWRSKICSGMHGLGFKRVTVDLDGFHSGSLSLEFKK